jgi:hypothetical protein
MHLPVALWPSAFSGSSCTGQFCAYRKYRTE